MVAFSLLQFKKGMQYVEGVNVIMILTIMKGNEKHFTSSGKKNILTHSSPDFGKVYMLGGTLGESFFFR